MSLAIFLVLGQCSWIDDNPAGLPVQGQSKNALCVVAHTQQHNVKRMELVVRKLLTCYGRRARVYYVRTGFKTRSPQDTQFRKCGTVCRYSLHSLAIHLLSFRFSPAQGSIVNSEVTTSVAHQTASVAYLCPTKASSAHALVCYTSQVRKDSLLQILLCPPRP
jgi:hypothetical protein